MQFEGRVYINTLEHTHTGIEETLFEVRENII